MKTNFSQRINDIFSLVLDSTEKYQDIKISNYTAKKDYLSDVYETVTKDMYSQEREMSMSLMELGRTEFDELMLETICANLYSCLTVILQNINGKGIRREAFLARMQITESDNQNCVARFRKRLQSDRLSLLKRVTTKAEVACYIPTLLKAYKDIFFIPRQDTDIIDISPYYIDIFTALMFDTDEKNNDKELLNSIDAIKSHSLWRLSQTTVKHIEDIYNGILDTALEDNRFLQLHFMEKLFGILTADEIMKIGKPKEDTLKIVDGIFTLRKLGFSRLNKEIIKRATVRNISAYERMIDSYIYPLCISCLKYYLNDIVAYLGYINKAEREEFLMQLRAMCYSFIKYSFPLKVSIYDTLDRLKRYKKMNIDDTLVISVLKLLQGIRSDDSKFDICCYLQSTKVIRHSDYDNIADKKKALIYDCDFTDLTFLQKHERFLYEDDLENSEKSEARIRY